MHFEKRTKNAWPTSKKRAVLYGIEIVSMSVDFLSKESISKAGSQMAKLESKSNGLQRFGRKKRTELKRLGSRVKK